MPRKDKQRRAAWRRRNAEHVRAYMADYRKRNAQHIKKQEVEYRLCNRTHIKTRKSNYNFKNKTAIKAYNAKRKHQYKLDAFLHYRIGKLIKCAHCKERRLGALTIDHIDNNGAAHRRLVKASDLYLWLKKHGYPPGFQILCSNCNWKKYLQFRSANLSQAPKAVILRRHNLRVKCQFMSQLGSSCSVCNCDGMDVLTVHHINGDGKIHRQVVANGFGSITFYKAILKSGDFSGLECRCFSCNDAEEWSRK